MNPLILNGRDSQGSSHPVFVGGAWREAGIQMRTVSVAALFAIRLAASEAGIDGRPVRLSPMGYGPKAIRSAVMFGLAGCLLCNAPSNQHRSRFSTQPQRPRGVLGCLGVFPLSDIAS
jgi:hypothetical protein